MIWIQGGIIRRFTDLVLDYTGTLSLDGVLLPGVAERLARISAGLRITIMTADTFGKAADQTKGLPVDFRIIKTGVEKSAGNRGLIYSGLCPGRLF